MGTIIQFPTQTIRHQTAIVNTKNITLAEALCKEIGVPANGNCIALRLGRRAFFSNAQAVAIWLTESIDSRTFDESDIFELTDTLATLLNEHLKKRRH